MQILSERPVIRQKKKLIMVWLGGPMISEDIGMLYFANCYVMEAVQRTGECDALQ